MLRRRIQAQEQIMETSGNLLEQIQVGPENGATEIRIPPELFWECVECFAENRMDAKFTFRPPNFVARLGAASSDRARDTLRNWSVVRQDKPMAVGR
jgi:hypothetical protein